MISDIDITKIRRLDGSLLLVLRELLSQESVTEAAKSLHLSQSAVSHSLSRLRDLFDDPLFIRLPHGLEATNKALELAPRVEQLLEMTVSVLGVSDSFDPLTSTRLFSLSAPEFVTVAAGNPLLNALGEAAPRSGIRFSHLATADAFDQIRKGKLDAALGRFDQVDSPHIETSTLFTDEYCVAARVGHPLLKRTCTYQNYVDCAHLWAEAGSELTSVETGLDYSAFHGSIVPRWLTALTLAAQSDMIVTCPRRLVESQARVLRLNIFELPAEAPPIEISLARKRVGSDAGASWFIDQVTQAFSS